MLFMFINILFSLGIDSETKAAVSNNGFLPVVYLQAPSGLFISGPHKQNGVLLVNIQCDPLI